MQITYLADRPPILFSRKEKNLCRVRCFPQSSFWLPTAYCRLPTADSFAQCGVSNRGSQGCGVPQTNRVNVDVANSLAQLSAQAGAGSTFAPVAQLSPPVSLPAPSGDLAQAPAAVPGAFAQASAPIAVQTASSGCANGSCAAAAGAGTGAGAGAGLSLRQRLNLQAAQRAAARSGRLAARAAKPGILPLAGRRNTQTSVAVSSTSSSGG